MLKSICAIINIIMKKKLIIFDMDGTVYLGKNLINGAKETFDYLNQKKIDYVFFTNNSSHDLDFYFRKIQNFGIKCSLEKNFYSSVEVTLSYLKDLGVHLVYCIGNKSFKDKVAKSFKYIDRYDENVTPDAVVCGFSTELVYDELKGACLYLEQHELPFIATNLDWRCPIEDGLYIPDCGGMCEWIYHCTGKRATVMGKPNPVMIDYLMKQFNVRKDEIIIIGDRLYTDILVGVNAHVDSVCVLSGESSLEDVKKYEHKPTYVIDSIKELPALLEE